MSEGDNLSRVIKVVGPSCIEQDAWQEEHLAHGGVVELWCDSCFVEGTGCCFEIECVPRKDHLVEVSEVNMGFYRWEWLWGCLVDVEGWLH